MNLLIIVSVLQLLVQTNAKYDHYKNLFIVGSIYYLLYAYPEVTVQVCGKFITDYFKVPHRYKLQGLHLCAMPISPIALDFTMGYIQ